MLAQKNVLIVGGGFGGVKTALELSKCSAYKVTLLSDTRDFRYYPALYRTATGGSNELSNIPLGELFGGKPVRVIIDSAVKLDIKRKTIGTIAGQHFEYDILVLALGSVTNFFGIRGLDEYAMGIKLPGDAEKFKAHLQTQLISEHQPDLNYVIVGGGPTGVELAGALPAYIKELMHKFGIKHRAVHIDLIEAMPRLVPTLPKKTGRAISRRLRRLGVKVMLNQPVQGETADELMVNGKPIRSHTVVWTAGVKNHPFFTANNIALDKKGKVAVDNLLQIAHGVFVIGDNASTMYSGMAQTALRDADYVAHNLIRHANGKPPFIYKPKRPVYITAVGDKWAAVIWGKVSINGRLGWYLRRAADWIGYHDLEPWWKASARLAAGVIKED